MGAEDTIHGEGEITETAPASIFFVHDKVYAAWGWDVRESNVRFIRDIDSGHFRYLYEKIHGDLGGADNQRAALALRTSYHHAIETLFSLIAASIQAPHCLHCWILKASTGQLRKVISGIKSKEPIKSIFRGALNWEDYANAIFEKYDCEYEKKLELIKKFSKFWDTLSEYWLSDIHIDEYNSIKHGLRVTPGGFITKFQVARPATEPVQEGDILDLGGSEYGSHYYIASPIEGAVKTKDDRHFSIKRRSSNWSVTATAARLELICHSIENIKTCLLRVNGQPETVYSLPDMNLFDCVIDKGVGPSALEVAMSITEAHIIRFDASELANHFDSWVNAAHSMKQDTPTSPGDSG